MQKSYRININIPFQLIYLPDACQVYSRNIYIPAILKLMNNDPTLTLHKHILGFNLTYMNTTNYQLMQAFNITHLTAAQLGKLLYKLPNYCMVN